MLDIRQICIGLRRVGIANTKNCFYSVFDNIPNFVLACLEALGKLGSILRLDPEMVVKSERCEGQ